MEDDDEDNDEETLSDRRRAGETDEALPSLPLLVAVAADDTVKGGATGRASEDS